MKAFLLFAVGGPVLILTKLELTRDSELVRRLDYLGKFVAFPLPLESVKESYAAHYEHVLTDPKETDELRVLDTDAKQIFTNVDLSLLGKAVVHQPK